MRTPAVPEAPADSDRVSSSHHKVAKATTTSKFAFPVRDARVSGGSNQEGSGGVLHQSKAAAPKRGGGWPYELGSAKAAAPPAPPPPKSESVVDPRSGSPRRWETMKRWREAGWTHPKAQSSTPKSAPPRGDSDQAQEGGGWSQRESWSGSGWQWSSGEDWNKRRGWKDRGS